MIPKSLTHRLEDVFKWAIPPRNPCIFDPKQSGGASNPSNDLTWRGPGEVELHPGRLTAGTYSHHPFRKENDLRNLHDSTIIFHVNLPGCIWLCPQWFWTLFGVPIFPWWKVPPFDGSTRCLLNITGDDTGDLKKPSELLRFRNYHFLKSKKSATGPNGNGPRKNLSI